MEKGYWLNKDSRTFLSRGYLQEGQTAEERIKEIALAASKYLKDPTFAEKFEDYLLRGWFSLASPIWSNFGTSRGLPISCVVGDTLIDTNEGPKKAKDIKLWDKVLTHKGNYKEVQHIILTEKKNDIYLFKVTDVEIKLTGNHPVLTKEGWVRTDELSIKNDVVAVLTDDFSLDYKPIQILEKTNEIQDVYDFTVADDHSFSVGGVILHNCNGSYAEDTMESILEKVAEIGTQSKLGSGTSIFLGDLRHRGAPISVGGESHGPVHFMELFESVIKVVSQSNIRRGSCAVYLPVEHPDIKEFLNTREEGHSIQDLSLGVTISDEWMESLLEGDKDKRKIWARIIQKRFETGYPYIFFSDTVNNNAPEVYKDKGLRIHASNLCSEISLNSSKEYSFVCCLSSMNLLHYDEWKHTDAVEVLTYFLDCVMEEYIQKTENVAFMQTAHKFANDQRAIGVGTLGWHSYLQSIMIPFESDRAKELNIEIHKFIHDKAFKASKELAEKYGEPELLKGYGRRNTTLLAIAPTTSSSMILGQISPSIEPLNSNYFVKDLAKGKFSYKNPFLKNLLKTYNYDTPEVWDIILKSGGSVQNLFFLTDEEKDVFKTFGEISQWEIIKQAADRQQYIDQAQSLNLMIHPDTPPKDVSLLLIEAWKLGVKTLYYQRSSSPTQELSRSLVECKSCEV